MQSQLLAFGSPRRHNSCCAMLAGRGQSKSQRLQTRHPIRGQRIAYVKSPEKKYFQYKNRVILLQGSKGIIQWPIIDVLHLQ